MGNPEGTMRSQTHCSHMAETSTNTAGEAIVIALTLLVSVSVGVAIYLYGAAVRDVCTDAGISAGGANFLAVLACAPILAALYSFDT